MQQHLDFMELIPLSGIRAALAKREAMLVLSHDLKTILWANDAGAQLAGEKSGLEAIGQDAQLTPQTKRQILALDLENTQTKTLMLRLAGSLHSALLQCMVTPLPLSDNRSAILISAAAQNQAASAKLSLPQHYTALLQTDGTVLEADADFATLNINSNTLSDLIIEVRDEAEGMLKRRVRAGQGTLPAMLILLNPDAQTEAYLFLTARSDAQVTDKTAAVSPAAALTAATPSAETTPEAEPEAIQEAAPETQASRFIWKIAADTSFTEISPEFATIVGSNAADVIGRKFADVAKVFGFDHDGTISALLNQRETWSGKRIFWPVEGTDQHIPVDLAALPAFARDKKFIGFSGFGVMYPALAETDPEAIGMALTPAPASTVSTAEQPQPQEPSQASLTSETIILMEALRASQLRQQAPATEPKTEEPAATPVEETAATPSNLIGEIRPARSEAGLSAKERSAFREIADRLRREVLQKAPKPTDDIPVKQEAAEHVAPAVEKPVEKLPHSDVPYPHDVLPANYNQAAQPPKLVADHSQERQQEEEDLNVLSGLPVPVLIHSADRLHFANQAFFDMTGYHSLDDLREAGGIDALFAQSDDSQASGMLLCLADGSRKMVEAHLQSVPWQGARALMLSLLPELILQADNDDIVAVKTGKPALVAVPLPEPVIETPQVTSVEATEQENIFVDEHSDGECDSRPNSETVPASPDLHELQTQIHELTAILDTATDGVVIIGEDGKIRSLNQSAAALFGYDVSELSGKSFAVLFAIESQRAALDYIHGLSGNGVASLLNDGREVIGREAQGRFIPLFMTIGKLPASKGYCAVMRDITQWKRAEEELTSARQEAERASTHKTEFLARISHEIRTPLNAIIGFSELMADERFGSIGNERYREYLRDIHRSGNHVLALVNDLLDISKIEAGALDLEFEAVALNDALAEAVAMMQPQANRERVIIRSSFSAFLPDIVADARSIRQVALNLLSNAIRFTGQGGQVIVSTSYEPDGQVIMRVRDTGIGMNPNELEQALKPFKQVSNHNHQSAGVKMADTKGWRDHGTGLGLPLTKAMVEANRAQFSIESTPEQGTTVEIAFPPTRVLAE